MSDGRFAISGVNDSFDVVSVNVDSDKSVHVGGPTDLELALYAMLEEDDISFIAEWNVPSLPYRIDAFASEVPSDHGVVRRGPARKGPVGSGSVRQGKVRVGFEADGPYHDRKRDRERDRRILSTGYVDQIVRLGYKQLKPWL